MKIIQLHIYLFMWFPATESQTNIPVTLGADVIITCDLDIKEIYWYKQKSPDPPVLMLRTFGRTYEGAEYENSIYELKYSVKTNSRLFITNITTDELGVYYCAKTTEPQKFSNGTKIYISDFVHKNQTSESHDPWITIIIIIITSVLFSAFLITVVLGLVNKCAKSTTACKESNSRDVNEQQFAETLLLKHLNGSRSCLSECRFSLLPSKTDEGRNDRRV